MENNLKLPFLDLLLIRSNDKIDYDWYQKPISSGRILNWFSNHPLKMKINIGLSFANRVLSLSHPHFHQQNYKKIISILEANNYPYHIMRRIIHKSKIFINNSRQNQITTDENTKYYSIPYISMLSEKVQRNFQDTNIRFGMKPQRKLRKIFTNTKDKIIQEKSGHIYKINCLDCNASYIGETSRSKGNQQKKGQRTKEHIYDYNSALRKRNDQLNARKLEYQKLEKTKTRTKALELEELKKQHSEEDETSTYKTALTTHAIKKQHKFDFDNVKALHQENFAPKRKALESLYICKEGYKACNFKIDTQFINTQTKQMIHSYAHNKSRQTGKYTS